eukprot:g13663.t1
MATQKNEVQYIFRGFDRVSPVARRIGRSLGGVKRVARQVSAVGAAGVAAGRQLGATLAPLGAIAGIAGGVSLGKAVTDFVALGDQAAKTARQINMPIGAYQELAYWAERNGLKAEQWATAQRALASRLGRAAAGDNKKFAELLGDLNIQMKDAEGNTRTMDAVLLDLAEAFEKNEDPATRMYIATQAFGEEMGVRMVDALAQGRMSMEDLRKEARRLGISLSDEDGAAAEQFADDMTNVQKAVQGASFAIARDILPAVRPLLLSLKDWIVANREIVAAKVGAAVAAVADALRGFDWVAFGQTLASIGDAVVGLVDFMGGWENAAMAAVAVMNGPLIASFLTIGKEVAILGKVLLMSPIGWIVGAIAWAASLIIRNWEGVSTWFGEQWDNIARFFKGGYEVIAGILTGDFPRAFEGLKDVVGGFADFWGKLFEGVAAAVRAVGQDIGAVIGGVSGFVDRVSGWFGDDDEDEVEAAPMRAGPTFEGGGRVRLPPAPFEDASAGQAAPAPPSAASPAFVQQAVGSGAAPTAPPGGTPPIDVDVILNITGHNVRVEGEALAPGKRERILAAGPAGGY